MKNTFDGKVNKQGERLLTRKKQQALHGIGMQNISDVVDKYGGWKSINIDEIYLRFRLCYIFEKSHGVCYGILMQILTKIKPILTCRKNNGKMKYSIHKRGEIAMKNILK